MDFDEAECCRVCRGEATPEEPLFHPCKCTGSIRYVHQDCLIDWLSHSNKTKCELCRHTFEFSPVFDPNMPSHVPWYVVIKRLAIQTGLEVLWAFRMLLVAFVWLILLPYMTVWMLRFYFWSGQTMAYVVSGDVHRIPGFLNYTHTLRREQSIFANALNGTLLPSLILGPIAAADHPSPSLRQFILDCLEGEVVTTVVVLVFTILFVLREWIHSNAPLPNLQLEPDENVQAFGLEPIPPGVDPPAAFPEAAIDNPDNAGVEAEAEIPNQVRFQRNIEDLRRRQQDIRRRRMDLEREIEELERGRLRNQRIIPPNLNETDAWLPDPFLHPESGPGPNPHRNPADSLNPIPPWPLTEDDPGLTNQPYQLRRRRLHPRAYSAGSMEEDAPGTSAAQDDDQPTSPVARRSGKRPDLPSQSEQSSSSGLTPVPSAPLAAGTSHWSSRPDDAHGSAAAATTTALGGGVFAVGFAASNPPFSSGAAPGFPSTESGVVDEAPPTETEPLILDQTSFDGSSNPDSDSESEPDSDDPEADGVDPADAAVAGGGPNPNNAGPNNPDLPDDLADREGIDDIFEALGVRGPIINLFQYFVLIFSLIALVLGAAVWIPFTLGKLLLVLNPLKMLMLPLLVLQLITDPVIDFCVDLVFPFMLDAITATAYAIWMTLVPLASNVAQILHPVMLLLPGVSVSSTGSATLTPTGLLPAVITKALGPWVDRIAEVGIAAWSQLFGIASMVLVSSSSSGGGDSGDGGSLSPSDAASTKIASAWFGQASSSLPLAARLTQFLNAVTATNLTDTLSSNTDSTALAYRLASRLQWVHTYWVDLAHSDTLSSRLLTCGLGIMLFLLGTVYIMYGGLDMAGERSRALKRGTQTVVSMVKVLFFLILELGFAPFVCGWLLDIATLPLFPEAINLQGRIAFARTYTFSSSFLHWFTGTIFAYLFSFSVSAFRELIRPGVLWFIRDPSDPQAQPMRDILEKPATNEMRRVVHSLILYSVVVLGGFGSVALAISYLPPLGGGSILPLHWRFATGRAASPVPWDVIILHVVVPPLFRRVKPRKWYKWIVGWWARQAARSLRLSAFFFGGRFPDEEGYYIYPSWLAWLTGRTFKLPVPEVSPPALGDAAYRPRHPTRAPPAQPSQVDDEFEPSVIVLDGRRLEAVVEETLTGIAPSSNARVGDNGFHRNTRFVDPRGTGLAFQRDGSLLRVPNYDGAPIVPGHRMLVRADRFG
ncbi:hypothetical protein BJ085DRAFT_34877, partial [Dimargaris cristalligena]